MAVFARVNGKSENFGAFGRSLQVLNCAATNMSQAQIDTLIQLLQATNTVSGISEFTAGTTDVLFVAVEGPTVADATIGAFTVTTSCTFVTK
jgi:hypothetical protein